LYHIQFYLAHINHGFCCVCVCDNKVASVTDVSNFDIYPPDNTVPPDDLTGWDKEF